VRVIIKLTTAFPVNGKKILRRHERLYAVTKSLALDELH
jgi:hypothetical protein